MVSAFEFNGMLVVSSQVLAPEMGIAHKDLMRYARKANAKWQLSQLWSSITGRESQDSLPFVFRVMNSDPYCLISIDGFALLIERMPSRWARSLGAAAMDAFVDEPDDAPEPKGDWQYYTIRVMLDGAQHALDAGIETARTDVALYRGLMRLRRRGVDLKDLFADNGASAGRGKHA